MPKNIIVVGGGQAGARGAKALRDSGFNGRITLIGDEPEYPYERPPLSKAFLKEPGSPLPYVLTPDSYEALGIKLITACSVEAIDRAARQVRLSTGSTLAYDQLLLATGSRIRDIILPGFPESDIFTLRTLADSRAIAARVSAITDRQPRVTIIGGGFIGLEVAATLSGLGCAVVVLELAERLLARVGCAQLSTFVEDYHRSQDIDIRLGVSVTGSCAGQLDISDGSLIETDFVIAGIGIVPNVALAEEAGIVVDDGVVVDAQGRTSDPAIFAAGDVTRQHHSLLDRSVRLESWHNANLQGEAAARAMIGAPPLAAEIPWVWSDQGNLNIQIAGVPFAVDRTIARRDPDDGSLSLFQFQANRLVGGITLNRGKDMIMIRRLLTAGLEIDIDDVAGLADPAVPLRQFMPRPAAPPLQQVSVSTGE